MAQVGAESMSPYKVVLGLFTKHSLRTLRSKGGVSIMDLQDQGRPPQVLNQHTRLDYTQEDDVGAVKSKGRSVGESRGLEYWLSGELVLDIGGFAPKERMMVGK